MKHTKIYELVQVISSISTLELKRALIAHHGMYTWNDKTDEPCVSLHTDDGPMDICIQSIGLTEDNDIEILSAREPGSDDYFQDVDFFDVEADHIEFILDSILSTKDVNDVAIDGIQAKISKFCRVINNEISKETAFL